MDNKKLDRYYYIMATGDGKATLMGKLNGIFGVIEIKQGIILQDAHIEFEWDYTGNSKPVIQGQITIPFICNGGDILYNFPNMLPNPA